MNSENNQLFTELLAEAANSLGVPVDNLPAEVDQDGASKILGPSARTLAIWRSTGRYNLPYIKAGRLVRYRVKNLIEFKIRRMRQHTGRAA